MMENALLHLNKELWSQPTLATLLGCKNKALRLFLKGGEGSNCLGKDKQ